MTMAGRLVGARWASPNTLCALLAGAAGLAFGARALTLGNVILHTDDDHERAHCGALLRQLSDSLKCGGRDRCSLRVER